MEKIFTKKEINEAINEVMEDMIKEDAKKCDIDNFLTAIMQEIKITAYRFELASRICQKLGFELE